MAILRHDRPRLHVSKNLYRAGATVLLLALMAGGCGRLKLTGNPPGNSPPELILVNTPPGGQLVGANPTVYWYGTDDDGRIVRYDYAVVPETGAGFSVEEFLKRHSNTCGEPDIESFIRCAKDSLPWVSIFVDSSISVLPTNARIPLYASFDTLDCDSEEVRINIKDSTGAVIDIRIDTVGKDCWSMSIAQFMFIRAVDDQGGESDIKYRSFLRDNHWPETRIKSFEAFKDYFSTPSLSETYRGISISWEGADNLDFLPGRAVLDYRWRIYGPYATGNGEVKDRPKLEDTIQFSAPIWESHSADPRKGLWVADTITTVYDLWRQVDSLNPPPDTTRTGFFLFLVQARDDASVADPTPAVTTFRAVYAKFERKLLVVDETAYMISPASYPSWIPEGEDPRRAQSGDTNQAFLFRMARLIDANIQEPHDFWKPELDFWQRADQKKLCTIADRCSSSVPLTELSRHEMVLYSDDDYSKPITQDPDSRVPLTQYLDIGGKLWLVSRVGLLKGTDMGQSVSPKEFDFLKDGNSFPPRYLGIAGLYYPSFFASAKQIPPSSNDEFIAAKGISSNDPALDRPANLPPVIDVDSMRNARHYLDLRPFLPTDDILGVPSVGYVLRWTDTQAPATRPLYLFTSWRPGYSPADQRLVAVRAVGPTLRTPKYKTAYMGCPLWFFKENECIEYVKGMTDWFYNQPIEQGP